MGDSASDVRPRWRCEHEVKSRLRTLVDYYSRRLRSGAIDQEVAAMWAGLDPLPVAAPVTRDSSVEPPRGGGGASSAAAAAQLAVDADASPDSAALRDAPSQRAPDELLKLSVAMTRKAFENPPRFLVPEDDEDPLPAHCLHLDILSAPALRRSLANRDLADVEAQLQRGTADFRTCLFAFADHVSCASGDVGCDRDVIVSFFTELSHIGEFSSRWSALAKNYADFIERHQLSMATGTTLLFESLPIGNADLLDRAIAVLFLTVPALTVEAVTRVCRLLALAGEAKLVKMFGRLSSASMAALVESLQSHFTMYLFQSNHACLNVLASALTMLHKANTAIVSRGLVPFSNFYNGTVADFDDDGIAQDFGRALQLRESPAQAAGAPGSSRSAAAAAAMQNLFCFSRYPCLIDARFKSKLLLLEGSLQQQQAHRDAVRDALLARLTGASASASNAAAAAAQFCEMRIRRDRLLESTMDEMQRNAQRLHSPLRVSFVGEDGIDAGGVTKEWFQLITRRLLDPQFGLFTIKQPENVLWFNPDVATEFLPAAQVLMMGQVLGLAVYNNVIIDVAFPQLVYRKLLSVEPDLEDMRGIDAAMATALQTLLNYDERAPGAPTVEEAYDRTFTYDHDVFGARVTAEIVPGGAGIVLTAANRREYVAALTRHLLTDCVARNFGAFKRGFQSVATRDMIASLHPVELETLLCGLPTLDLRELRAGCTYEGYRASDPCVTWFWRVAEGFTLEQQKRLLHFCTGSDRVPVGGLKDLHFKIGRNGDDDAMLPTSHTCFNHLLLPRYSSEDVLRGKLLLAIQNCEGFGLQ